MNDIELAALSAVVASENIGCAGDNAQRLIHGYSPAWTSDCKLSDAEAALWTELVRRGVLPSGDDNTKGATNG